MVGRILQQNYVRKWLIRYHKWLESSGYIRCYKGWVFRASIIRSIRRYLTSFHQTWWIRIVLAGKHRSINRRVAREFFENIFDEENPEWEQSDNEDDVDSERNIFDDIIIDDEWIDNPDSTLKLTFIYQTYDTCIPVVFVSVFCYFVFQGRRFGIVLVLHF